MLKLSLEKVEEKYFRMTDEIFKYIEIELTIKEFGYDPRDLSRGSAKLCIGRCEICQEKKVQPFRSLITYRACKDCSGKRMKRGNEKLNTRQAFYLIDFDLTEKAFGYKVEFLKEKSPRKVIAHCEACNEKRVVQFRNAMLHKVCVHCSDKSEQKKEKLKTAKTGKKRSEATRKKISESHKGRKLSEEHKQKIGKGQIGRKPPKETRKKLSSWQKGKILPDDHPFHKKGKEHHSYGKPAPHGKGEWYTHESGEKFFMRSQWELKYAKHLDNLGIPWEFESKVFDVTYEYKGEVKEGTYTPDFYVNGEWVEIKGYWRDDALPKFEAFKEQYPNEKITLLMKDDLKALGIDIK